jgi:hypothetical protein
MTAKNLRDDADQAGAAVEADERNQGELDSFIAKNRDALNESLERCYAELAEDDLSERSMRDVIEDGKRRFSQKD